jgi:hypothetical protein
MTEEMENKELEGTQGVSRRDFIKGAASSVAGVAAITALGACAPKVVNEAGEPAAPAAVAPAAEAAPAGEAPVAAATSCARVPGYAGEGDWLGTAPVVADGDIASTVEVDVLVIGAGHAGLMAALSAAEAGVKVAVVEKKDEAGFQTDYWHRVGEDIGHVNSQWLINRGYGPYDTGEVVTEFVKRSGGRVNPEIVKLYVDNSGAMFDKMIETYESYADLRKERYSAVEFEYTGDNAAKVTYDFSNMLSDEMVFVQCQQDPNTKYPIDLNGYKTWPCNAMFQGPVLHKPVNPFVSALRYFELFMDQKTKDLGAQWFYEHTAQVLTKDDSGAVTGVIAKDKDGKYVKFVGKKGTLVATGDFSGNPDMCWALLDDIMEWGERAGTERGKLAGMYQDGYGHKMVSWAGGMVEPSPRGTMGGGASASGPWGMSPMLQLNARAERFANEAAAPWISHAGVRQPKGLLTVITDAKYMDSIRVAGLDHGGPNFGRGKAWTDDFDADMAQVAAAGKDGFGVRGITVAERNPRIVFGANTLEELAGYLGYTGDQVTTFVASIKHYNEMCSAGVDSDFGKDPKALIPIDTAPFYGCTGENTGKMSIGLVTMAGMVTDNKLNVLGKDGNPIKGLYVAGNTLGGRYGLSYVTPYAGNSVGMALTHGWMAGKFIAAL